MDNIPKRKYPKLTAESPERQVPIGWGVWVDEDFSVPWYLNLICTVISIGILVFAIWYTVDHGLDCKQVDNRRILP